MSSLRLSVIELDNRVEDSIGFWLDYFFIIIEFQSWCAPKLVVSGDLVVLKFKSKFQIGETRSTSLSGDQFKNI